MTSQIENTADHETYDVYSFGMVSSSTLYRIRGAFPGPEGYAEIIGAQQISGGEAANSSIVLARLGARVKLDGNWLGADDGGRRTKTLLAEYQIDTSRLPLKKGFTGASEVVFAANGTRTIFGNYGRLLEEANWNMPHVDDVTKAKVVCVDPFFKEASSRVAEIGFHAGIPVVTVDCRYNDPLIRYVSAVVIAESFIRDNYADRQLEDLFREYQRHCDGLIVFTFGDNAIWYAMPDEAPRTFQPYAIEPVDSTGGGDSFRAGIVYGFLKGWDQGQMIEFAAAVAGIICTRFPGVLDAPTYEDVVGFIREQRT